MQRIFVVVRHGQSEWNAQNRFTGWRDPGLTAQGVAEARRVGRELKSRGFVFDIAFSSPLRRVQKTLEIILKELREPDMPIMVSCDLKERDYGELSGMGKEDAYRLWGAEQVRLWRRAYDIAPPGGESLKDTVARVLPFYCREVLPRILRGERVLMVGHGNSLRGLAMVLDRTAPEDISSLEIATGMITAYRLNADSTVASKQIFLANGAQKIL